MLRALAVIAALAVAHAAVAASPLEPAFGNTVVSTYPDGRTGLLWLQRDGTYTAKGRRRTASSGRWQLADDKICLNQAKPVAVPIRYCTPIPRGGGATWSAKAVTGETIRVKIVPGRGS